MEKRSHAPVFDARTIAEYAVFIAIILAMRIMGLSMIPVGPLKMTLTMVPIAIGAMLLGSLGGAILGGVFGLTSLYDAMTGTSMMTGFFFQVNPFLTVLLCVGTRVLVGAATGWLFRLFLRLDRRRIWCYFAGGLAAPMLNTILFMGFIVLVFYQTEFVQNMVSANSAITNPLMFVIVVVGLQGLFEWLTGCIIGGGVAKAVAHALKLHGNGTTAVKKRAADGIAPEKKEDLT